MPISKLGQRRQVVIPKEICDELNLQEGDFVEVTKTEGVIVIKPKKLVDPDEALTLKEAKTVRKGEAQLKQGKHVAWEDLKQQLKAGAIQRAERDRALAEEWFPVDEEAWHASQR